MLDISASHHLVWGYWGWLPGVMYYNNGHTNVRLLDVLPNFLSLTTSEMKH